MDPCFWLVPQLGPVNCEKNGQHTKMLSTWFFYFARFGIISMLWHSNRKLSCSHSTIPHSMYIQCTINVYSMCIQCVFNVYSICIQWTFNVHSMCFQYVFNVYSLYIQCLFNVHSLCIQWLTIYLLFSIGKLTYSHTPNLEMLSHLKIGFQWKWPSLTWNLSYFNEKCHNKNNCSFQWTYFSLN